LWASLVDNEEVAPVSDERQIDEEESKVGTHATDDDVEAHSKVRQNKVRQAGDEGADDDGDVEAHIKLKQ
jgi:hypothetical protein